MVERGKQNIFLKREKSENDNKPVTLFLIMDVIVDMTNGKSSGTFKFQYSRHRPVHPDPRFVPNDKKLSEKIIGYFFSEFRKNEFNTHINEVKVNEDDSHKKADILIEEDGIIKGVQITRLLFTRYEERKAIALDKGKQLADALAAKIDLDFPIIVNIFPATKKDVIPLSNKKRGKSKVESELVQYIANCIILNHSKLSSEDNPIWIHIDNKILSPYFRTLVLNPVPKDAFPRFYGKDNIYVNYDFNDVAYEPSDVESAIDEVYRKKNNGAASILLIWADEFELTRNKRLIAEKLYGKFINSSFQEVYFMTFQNNVAMFLKSLELWPLKCPYFSKSNKEHMTN